HLVRFDYLQNLIVTQIQQLEKPDTLDNNFCSPDLSPVLTQSIELSNKTKKIKLIIYQQKTIFHRPFHLNLVILKRMRNKHYGEEY
ncbi:hypothetical protein, partial [Proteus mirabilis]